MKWLMAFGQRMVEWMIGLDKIRKKKEKKTKNPGPWDPPDCCLDMAPSKFLGGPCCGLVKNENENGKE